MISYLKGSVLNIMESSAILVNNDIGYKVRLTPDSLSKLKVGGQAEFYIHQHIREDAVELFGFIDMTTLNFFERLVSISGIGPKTALGVLAATSIDNLEAAIVRGDASILTKVSGIGKKTAERIVLELKGKISRMDLSDKSKNSTTSSDVEVIEALENLGYSADQARRALKDIGSAEMSTDDKLKAALKTLAK